jgi:hypothetical protein
LSTCYQFTPALNLKRHLPALEARGITTHVDPENGRTALVKDGHYLWLDEAQVRFGISDDCELQFHGEIESDEDGTYIGATRYNVNNVFDLLADLTELAGVAVTDEYMDEGDPPYTPADLRECGRVQAELRKRWDAEDAAKAVKP